MVEYTEMLVGLNEKNLAELKQQQSDITKLFPKFPPRVKALRQRGGIRLVDKTKGLWTFEVVSGTIDNKKWTTKLHFRNVPQLIRKYGQDGGIYKNDRKTINRTALSDKIYNELDLELECDDPSFLYWGFRYIATKNKYVYGGKENRRPDIRNPKQYGAFCKHIQLIMEQIPFYLSTFSATLNRFYDKEIKEQEKLYNSEEKKEVDK